MVVEMKNEQIADVLRPKTLDEIVGQPHLFGERGVVRRMINSGRMTNMIFYGPPGTGKTTAASVIAGMTDMVFHRVNATNATISEVKDILSSTGNLFGSGGILLYIDEIQYFNRKQQQALLEYIEDGRVTLIASTTENPQMYIYNAVISRSSLFEFKPVSAEDCSIMLTRALEYLNEENATSKTATHDTLVKIASMTKGDVRHAIGLFENAYFAAENEITVDDAKLFSCGAGNYNDDVHYDLLSCLQKSIRGSCPDAAIFYLAKILSQGDLISACRRLQVIASEDIGLAYPQAAAIVRACCESAKELGLPEGRIPLANATILLATAPKSNTAYAAYANALSDIEAGRGVIIPEHLRSPLYKGYKYPHDYPDSYVDQQYLPDDLKNATYYRYGDNKTERAAQEYWKRIKKQ